MSFLRRTSTPRLIALCAALLVVAAGGAAIAVAASSGGAVPQRKPLANAVHDALASPDVQGVTARIEFTNHLVDGIDLRGSNPLLAGATGRLWATDDGRFRLELQSSGGDAQVVSDGKTWWAYDGESKTVYRGTVPKHDQAERKQQGKWRVPTVSRIQRVINRVMRHAAITGPTPGNVGGEPAYTVRMEPRRNGGLLGALEFAWDAQRGTPLRGAVYAKGDSNPVLELKATGIDFGPVAGSVFDVPAPTNGVKTATIKPRSQDSAGAGRGHGGSGKHVTGLRRVKPRAGFDVSAPGTLAGKKRQEVALLGRGRNGSGVLVTYGRGLDGIAVIEKRVRAGETDKGPLAHAELPTVTIGAATGQEIETPLGTAVRFQRSGVSYTVIASAPKALVETAARGL